MLLDVLFMCVMRFWPTTGYSSVRSLIPPLIQAANRCVSLFQVRCQSSEIQFNSWSVFNHAMGKDCAQKKRFGETRECQSMERGMPCFGRGSEKLKQLCTLLLNAPGHPGIAQIYTVYIKLDTAHTLDIAHGTANIEHCIAQVPNHAAILRHGTKWNSVQVSSMNMSNTSNYARTDWTQQKFEQGAAYFFMQCIFQCIVRCFLLICCATRTTSNIAIFISKILFYIPKNTPLKFTQHWL